MLVGARRRGVCLWLERRCLEAEASGTAIRAITGRPPSERPAASWPGPGMCVGRAVASVANLLDFAWRWSPGRWPSVSGQPFFDAARGDRRPRPAGVLGRDPHRAGGPRRAAPLIGAAAVAFRQRLRRVRPRIVRIAHLRAENDYLHSARGQTKDQQRAAAKAAGAVHAVEILLVDERDVPHVPEGLGVDPAVSRLRRCRSCPRCSPAGRLSGPAPRMSPTRRTAGSAVQGASSRLTLLSRLRGCPLPARPEVLHAVTTASARSWLMWRSSRRGRTAWGPRGVERRENSSSRPGRPWKGSRRTRRPLRGRGWAEDDVEVLHEGRVGEESWVTCALTVCVTSGTCG